MNVPAKARTHPRKGSVHLSVVIPVFNESGNIEALLERLVPVLDGALEGSGGLSGWDALFVDDGSADDSIEVIKRCAELDSRLGLIGLSRNFGKEIAMAAGLENARGHIVVLIDADLQHPPELIPTLIELWRDGYDMVYGCRSDRETDSRLRRLLSRAFYRLFSRVSGTRLPYGAGDYRLMDRKVVDALVSVQERVRFTKGLYAWVGFKSIGVDFQVSHRDSGQSSFSLRNLLKFAIDGIVSFSTLPLKIWSYIGIIISLLSFVYGGIFLFKTLIFGIDVPGFPTIILSSMLFSGIQLISLGVIGEYLARIYEESKGRPLYIVDECIEPGTREIDTNAVDRDVPGKPASGDTALEMPPTQNKTDIDTFPDSGD